MTSQHPSELDSGTADSMTSSPRSDHPPPHRLQDDYQPRIRFMCSFGGRILPRPHDNQLRYVGGDTRIVAVHRSSTFSALLTKLSKLSGTTDFTVKYQLPNEDLDALISVTTNEDVENMMEEYDRLTQGLNPKAARLRLFLFPIGISRASSIDSLLDGSTKRDHWFFDALNGGGGSASIRATLERGQSEASSIVSEVPDYLFGLDNSDETREPKPKNRSILAENVSVSNPGSPAHATSFPYYSTSSAPCVPSLPDLRPVRTKPENPNPAVDSKDNQIEGSAEAGEPPIPHQTGYPGNPMWQYLPESHFPGPTVRQVPVYYMPGPVPGSNVQVQHIPMPAPYVQRFTAPAAHIPVGYRHPVPHAGQLYGAGMKPVTAVEAYEFPAGMMSDAGNQQVYYGARNTGVLQGYSAAVVQVGADLQGTGTEMKIANGSQSL